jgi:hypothetical protein
MPEYTCPQSIDKVPLFAKVGPPDGRSNSKARAEKPEGGSCRVAIFFCAYHFGFYHPARTEDYSWLSRYFLRLRFHFGPSLLGGFG